MDALPHQDEVDEDEVDELQELIGELEDRCPGARRRIEDTSVLRFTTRLWQRREALAMPVEEVAERSGLTPDEVDLVEDNAVDVAFDVLVRYASAVGLQFDLQTAAG
ncbi:MAG: hypothetical protein ACRDZQ_01405 [Acidimicrobiales bacterium]